MRAPRVCPAPGCPNVQPCATHVRPNSHARGYGREHRNERARWVPRVATGRVKCWRCQELIQPNEPWDLGHLDGSAAYGGPEHANRCNRSAAGKAAHDHN